jgi:hypothetical protein
MQPSIGNTTANDGAPLADIEPDSNFKSRTAIGAVRLTQYHVMTPQAG